MASGYTMLALFYYIGNTTYPCGNTELIVVVVVVFDKLIKTRCLSFVDFLLSSFQDCRCIYEVMCINKINLKAAPF